MQLQKGATVGNCVIGEPIGAGGMGEIYRAKDTKLARGVAIKVLPQELARDKERLSRFEREAKLLAQLNHTNIATIHGLEELDGQPLLVMELVEGETLAAHIARGPIPIDEVVPIFTQIAEGLEAAHEKGIIHRDLKPANVMITPDGHVKILDFGLAKAYQEDAGPTEDASQSPTVTRGTELGVILGTASYMSPEQARGKHVDKRTDLWAFGCCLYEALTGRKAFVGETTTDTLAAIVNAEPDWEKLPAAMSSSTRRLLRRCLAKSARRRLTDAGMARLELEEAESGPTVVALAPRHSRAWGLVGVALAAAAITWFVREPRPREVRRLTVEAPTGTTLGEAPGTTAIDVSPDGRFIAFVAFTESDGNRLYLRAIDEFESRLIDTGSAGVSNPRFTPDGKWLGYFDEKEETLMRFAIEGGRPEAVCETGDQIGFDWDGGGGIVFARRNAGLWRCGSDDAEPTLLTSANYEQGEGGHLTPHSLPGGDAILFTVAGPSLGLQLVLPGGGTEYRILGVRGYSARYLPTGHIVYAVPGALRQCRST